MSQEANDSSEKRDGLRKISSEALNKLIEKERARLNIKDEGSPKKEERNPDKTFEEEDWAKIDKERVRNYRFGPDTDNTPSDNMG